MKSEVCAICGGKKTIPNAELCGFCKKECNGIYDEVIADFIKTNSKNFWNQAKEILKQRKIRKKYEIRSMLGINSAGFPNEKIVN